jgi:hypothetical protein
MFYLEGLDSACAGRLPGIFDRDATKAEKDIHFASFTCNPFRCGCQENFAAFACCDTLTASFNRVSGLGDTMAYDSHQKAAEFHMLAAHAHQAAAAHHGKEDHLTAHEQSRQAMEYASKAFEFSKQAHDESSAIFKKLEKKS